MSNGLRRQQNSGIWSILRFNTGPRRRTSISLPTRSHPLDPFEKPDRHCDSNTNSRSTANMGTVRSGPILQGQRGRYLRFGAAIALIVILLFILGPKDRTTKIGQYIESEFFCYVLLKLGSHWGTPKQDITLLIAEKLVPALH